MHDFSSASNFLARLDERIRALTRHHTSVYTATVAVVGSGAYAGKVKVRLPGEDIPEANLPWAPVTGTVPAVGDAVLTIVDFASRRVITG